MKLLIQYVFDKENERNCFTIFIILDLNIYETIKSRVGMLGK